MRISRRMLFMLVTVLVVLVASTIAYAAVFTDITGHWAEDEITSMYEEGIVKGHEDGTYGPEELVTRAQMAVFLDRLHEDLSADMGDGGMDADSCKACHDNTSLITGRPCSYRRRCRRHPFPRSNLHAGGPRTPPSGRVLRVPPDRRCRPHGP